MDIFCLHENASWQVFMKHEILELADHADDIGLDAVWIGDSLLAKPRHDPITLMAAIAGENNKNYNGDCSSSADVA